MNRRATAEDVARHAGVSQATVSRAFTPGGSVSIEAREKVQKAAQELGYRPNALARGLTQRRTGLIGLVTGDLSSLYDCHMLSHLGGALRAEQWQTLLMRTARTDETGGALLEAMAYQVDAIIVAAGSVPPAIIQETQTYSTPLVMLGKGETPGVDTICCDNPGAVRLIARHLLAAGHRRIAYIAGNPTAFSEQERSHYFTEALAEAGVPLTASVPGEYTYEGGQAAALALLTAPEPPEAIFCGNDTMALGALDAARHILGLKSAARCGDHRL
ncbi:LacI family DNA-binding transcriptional regulator [Elstera litoralis]|uniref:LacI family DNA-binding transcriptional regulator n=1 Tax=Elstera litoralis TaxID=552518 RepID=UPI0006969A52|nr:LacI family DNA-binding transcriptional regulator [Elstera litoralis]